MNSTYTLNILIILLFSVCSTFAGTGSTHNDSFNKTKQALEQNVYYDHRITIYCGVEFDEHKNVNLPDDFTTKYKNRANKIEWEHVVPAENFGRAFIEWREGHEDCVDNKGNSFKGRKCAEKVNLEYRYMQADMYNLFPAIGSVNALRQNYDFTILPDAESDFNGCEFKVDGNKVEPPEHSRGVIARTYLYFDAVYPKYNMSKQTRQLMEAWDRMYPVDEWECIRYSRIRDIQMNENPILSNRCTKIYNQEQPE